MLKRNDVFIVRVYIILSMSFQGIRKIREAKRESPLLLESTDLGTNSALKPVQFTFELKSSSLSNDIRNTRDSDKMDPTSRQTRKSSFGMNSSSKEKDKKLLVGNFLHINLDSLKNPRQVRGSGQELKSDRMSTSKNPTEDTERDGVQKVGLHSFRLDFVVGKGGFGKVWKVFQKSTNRIYAMKQMQKVKIISKRSVHSVMNEKQLLQKLSNPFLVNMLCAFQNRENLYLVMDYCNRGDLRYHLGNRRKFKEEESRFFLACIVLCLEYLHSKKVIHRDLKPQNLVIDDRGYLRVTDLGVSREVKPNNADDTSGTPGYMAPQVICKTNHSYPVDYFALGVMAYEFMTGRRPYVGANRKEIRQKILAKQVQLDEIPPYGWSRDSVDFVNRLIQRKPQARLGANGIEQIKYHSFFKKIDWERLQQRKILPPFMPQTVEQDYTNYKECISEDTEIQDMEEYKMILRHRDTQEAFYGYDFNSTTPSSSKSRKERLQPFTRKELEQFTHTTMSIRRRK